MACHFTQEMNRKKLPNLYIVSLIVQKWSLLTVFLFVKSESINEYSFFRKLETGILLCKHANTVTLHAEEFTITNPNHPVLNRLKVPQKQVRFNEVSVIDSGLLDFVNTFKIWVGFSTIFTRKSR